VKIEVLVLRMVSVLYLCEGFLAFLVTLLFGIR